MIVSAEILNLLVMANTKRLAAAWSSSRTVSERARCDLSRINAIHKRQTATLIRINVRTNHLLRFDIGHPYLNFKVVKANKANTSAKIQNLAITLLSLHPISSK